MSGKPLVTTSTPIPFMCFRKKHVGLGNCLALTVLWRGGGASDELRRYAARKADSGAARRQTPHKPVPHALVFVAPRAALSPERRTQPSPPLHIMPTNACLSDGRMRDASGEIESTP